MGGGGIESGQTFDKDMSSPKVSPKISTNFGIVKLSKSKFFFRLVIFDEDMGVLAKGLIAHFIFYVVSYEAYYVSNLLTCNMLFPCLL